MEKTAKPTFSNVNEYIALFPENVQELLQLLRKTIREAAPDATEIVSYNMPAYRQNSVLVYFAANKGHIGFYPTPSPIVVFKDELEEYKTSKGAIQFPLEKGIPCELVRKLVLYRVTEDLLKG